MEKKINLKFLSIEMQLIISAFTFLYYCSLRSIIDNLFLCIDKILPFKYAIIILPFILLFQLKKFYQEYKTLKLILIRFVFSCFFSVLISTLSINSLQLYSYITSTKSDIKKYNIPIDYIDGLNSRKRVHFIFNKKEHLRKVSDYLAQTIEEDGISLYCVHLKMYEGKFGYKIIESYNVKFCN